MQEKDNVSASAVCCKVPSTSMLQRDLKSVDKGHHCREGYVILPSTMSPCSIVAETGMGSWAVVEESQPNLLPAERKLGCCAWLCELLGRLLRRSAIPGITICDVLDQCHSSAFLVLRVAALFPSIMRIFPSHLGIWRQSRQRPPNTRRQARRYLGLFFQRQRRFGTLLAR